MLTYETTKTSPKSIFQFLSGLFSSGQLYMKHLAKWLEKVFVGSSEEVKLCLFNELRIAQILSFLRNKPRQPQGGGGGGGGGVAYFNEGALK